ncbi:AAA family ATPase [Dietzia cinnamea]|uniref:AAA family ATPase n=1 Tax=Dietzia cinnamea TaxID=321318 RepID=UPI0028833841|nr:AAA family ATPase [Dietzia cinnamea]
MAGSRVVGLEKIPAGARVVHVLGQESAEHLDALNAAGYPSVALTVSWEDFIAAPTGLPEGVDLRLVDRASVPDAALRRAAEAVRAAGRGRGPGRRRKVTFWPCAGDPAAIVQGRPVRTVNGGDSPFVSLADPVRSDQRTASKPPAKSEAEWDDWFRDNLVDREALDNLPSPRPLIDGWLNLNSTAVLIGDYANLKSFHVIDMACCIATGTPFHGAPVDQGPVIIAVGEGLEGMKLRVRAWEIAHNGGERIRNLYTFPVAFHLHEVDSAKAAAFGRGAAGLGARLIVFDTLARFTTGANENATQDMGVAVDNLDTIRTVSGACALVVHHTTRNADHGRGSTAVPAAADTELIAKRSGTDTGTLGCNKQKHGPEHDDVKFVTKVVDVGDGESSLVLLHETDAAEDGQEVVIHRPEPKGKDDREANVLKVAYEIHHVFRGEFTPYSQIAAVAVKRLEGGKRAFYNAMNGLRDQERVECHPEDAEKQPHLARWRVSSAAVAEWAYPSREELAQAPGSTTDGVWRE